MTEEDKEILVKAINCKYPCQNLTKIFYNTGRALPFTAQRFPDGRVSDWYRNQYVEVVRIEPGGKHGKYGQAYGYYYRNGERADSSLERPEDSWCTKEETEPQPIPCCGCGSWVLLDIIGENSTNPIKIHSLDDLIGFGKYRELTLKEAVRKDWQYVKWAIFESGHIYTDVDKLLEYHMENRPILQPNDIISFGKYKGKSIKEIYEEDVQYLSWLSDNNDSFVIDWDLLKQIHNDQ